MGELQSIGYHGQPMPQAFRRVDPPVAVLVDLASVFPANRTDPVATIRQACRCTRSSRGG